MIDHMTHLEDLVLTQGSVGAMKIQNHLWSIQTGSAQISTKWDGAPAIFAGWDEEGFFVSTKSFLNKIPIIYRTHREIHEAGLQTGLRDKLQHCLHYLDKVVPKGMILQGDLLFTPGDITWDGEYMMFHPNTLVYGIKDEYWQTSWQIGVTWHTWIAKNGDISNPRFGRLLTTKEVLSIDPIIQKYEIEDDITTAPRDAFARIDMTWLDKVASHPHLPKLLIQAYNRRIKQGLETELAQELYAEIALIAIEDVSKLKTAKGIESKKKNFYYPIFEMIRNKRELQYILDFQNEVRVAKQTIINSLENHSKVKTWVKTDDGLVPSAHEGYVVIGQSESMKIVDRQQFSHMNFSPTIHKGWNTPTRI